MVKMVVWLFYNILYQFFISFQSNAVGLNLNSFSKNISEFKILYQINHAIKISTIPKYCKYYYQNVVYLQLYYFKTSKRYSSLPISLT